MTERFHPGSPRPCWRRPRLRTGTTIPPRQGNKPPPFAVLQLDEVRDATAQFLDVEAAEPRAIIDIGLFVPNMGWHYMKDALVDGGSTPTKPSCWCMPTIPAAASASWSRWNTPCRCHCRSARPLGFVGRADEWDANQEFQLWTLHAWVFEFNQDGVFAPFNPRVP